MLLKHVLIFSTLFYYSSTFANCLEYVPNEYILTTSYPDQVLSTLNVSLKTSSQDGLFIYNHRQNYLPFKTTQKIIKNLSESTLVLKLNSKELKKIQSLDYVNVTSNCFVESLNYDSFNFPNDPLYSNQWGLIQLNNELDLLGIKFDLKVKVAVSDTGFDFNHDDLQSKLWTNQVELTGRLGFDDDGNGCIDDIHGCDVTLQNGDIGLNTYKSNLLDHGTHVAGIIGAASSNSIGVAGAAINTELILIRAFSNQRRTTTADLLKSVYYAVNINADVLNCSWGTGSSPTKAEFNAFEYARQNDVVVVVAAGNDATYASRTSPAGLPNVLSVGSHNSSFQLSTFSNFGDSVDILAPGGDGIERKNEGIYSTAAYSKYLQKKGTSMSAPFVTAAIANLKSAFPNLSRNELINILLFSADQKTVSAYFDPKYSNYAALLNFKKALQVAKEYNSGVSINDFKKEPKSITFSESSNWFEEETLERDLSSETQSTSGCNSNQMKSEAHITSWIFLLLPMFWLQIKKRTLK